MMSRRRHLLGVSLAAALLLPLALPRPAAADDAARLAQAKEYLDLGKPQEALPLIEQVLGRREANAGALLLRSTARIMLGDAEPGIADLRRALKLDPSLRQGWLNLAAVEISEERYDGAYDAFRKAEELDPAAPDNQLNLGAVLIFQGKLEEASRRFDRYLEGNPESADAFYLVAANYALGGYEALAVEHLARAIELDEKMRLKARSDNKFVLLGSPQYHELLVTDRYTIPPGAHRADAAFAVPYSRDDGRLLGAVIDALHEVGEAFDPRIEATERWALVWGDFRIKVTNRADGTGVVLLSAPAARFTPAEWQRRSDALFAAVRDQLARQRPTVQR